MSDDSLNRRDFLKRTGRLAAAAGAAGLAGNALGAADAKAATGPRAPAEAKPAPADPKAPAKPADPKASAGMPTVKLGSLEVSRLILGSNPFWGYAHKPGNLGEQMKAYYTDAKITEVLNEAADCGITAVASPPAERWIGVFKRYLDSGGKLKIWIAQPDGPPEQMKDEIATAVKGGAKAVFVQGARVEEQYGQKKLDVLKAWVEHIKNLGAVAGLAAHWPEIHPDLEGRGFPTDFYFQCMFNVSKGELYRLAERTKAVETIRKIEKPVVAYKILGAGRLTAPEGFEYAFNHLRRKDAVCVGVYTKDAVDQIRENATLTEALTTK